MDVKWDGDSDAFYIKEKINNQTLEMGFQEDWNHENNTLNYNVYLSIYNKRKHMTTNESNHIITGKDPIKDALTAIRIFKQLENYVLSRAGDSTVIIYAHWVDNRRRDAYYRVLSKMGYTYQNLFGIKVIAKKFTPENIKKRFSENQ